MELSRRQSLLWALVPPGMVVAFGSMLADELGYDRGWLVVVGLIGLVIATGAIVVVFAWKGVELLRRRTSC
jgi:hypothetical protein